MRNFSTCNDEHIAPQTNGIVLQLTALVTLTALHLSPYVVIYASQGSWSGLLYVICGMLSGPFAQAGLLGFYLIVGTRAQWQRRMIVGLGILVITLVLGLAVNEYAIFMLPAFATATLATAVTLFLITGSRPFQLGRSSWPPRFSLGEAAGWIFVAGALFGLTRWMGGDRLTQYTWTDWENDLGPHSIIHGAFVGLMVAVYALPLLAHSRRLRWWTIFGSGIAWVVLPLLEMATLYLYAGDFSTSSWESTKGSGIYGVAVSGVIWLMAWGTVLPLKVATGRPARGKPPPKSVDPPPSTDDFRELS